MDALLFDSSPKLVEKGIICFGAFAIHSQCTFSETEQIRTQYMAGGYGYGHAKQALFEILLREFAQERGVFSKLMADRAMLHRELEKGAEKARAVAHGVMGRLRPALGFGR